MDDVLAHRPEQRTPEPAQTARADHQREGAGGRIDQGGRGMVVDHPHLRLDGAIGAERLVDEPLDPRPGRVLAVVRIELRTGLIEEVPGVHDLEAHPVRGRFERRPAQRIPIAIRTVDTDHDTPLTSHSARLPVPPTLGPLDAGLAQPLVSTIRRTSSESHMPTARDPELTRCGQRCCEYSGWASITDA